MPLIMYTLCYNYNVYIDLIVDPDTILLSRSKKEVLRMGEEITIECRTSSANPASSIVWTVNQEEYNDTVVTVVRFAKYKLQ